MPDHLLTLTLPDGQAWAGRVSERYTKAPTSLAVIFAVDVMPTAEDWAEIVRRSGYSQSKIREIQRHA